MKHLQKRFRVSALVLALVLINTACPHNNQGQNFSKAKAAAYDIQHATDASAQVLATLQQNKLLTPQETILYATKLKAVNKDNDHFIDVGWDAATLEDAARQALAAAKTADEKTAAQLALNTTLAGNREKILAAWQPVGADIADVASAAAQVKNPQAREKIVLLATTLNTAAATIAAVLVK